PAPDNRYPTAADFAADLRRWLGYQPTTVGRKWLGLRRFGLWVRREPGWAALFCVALVAAWIVNSLWWRADAAFSRATSETQAREEIEVRKLLSDAHARLRSKRGAHAEDVWKGAAPKIARQAAHLSKPELVSQIGLELRSLVLAAQSEPAVSEHEFSALPVTPNLSWRAAIHPLGNEI